jgi:superfamily II DNA or RNA helicase
VVQAVGRALRKYPGKKDVHIFDWCDLPLLKKQQVERLKDYQKEYKIDKASIKNINI